MTAVSAAMPAFSSLRRRKPPQAGAFFAPVDLDDLALIEAIAVLCGEVISIANPSIPFQRRNSRSLVIKTRGFLSVFEYLKNSASSLYQHRRRLSAAATLCFKELYILLHRSRILLEYCSQSSRLWLLLCNFQISGHFHDLTSQFSTLLDVFPSDDVDLNLSVDVEEQIELLRKQTKRSSLYIDPQDETLRLKIHSFLTDFESGREPEREELREVFVDRLGIRNGRTCRTEIEFLEEQIYNQEDELDPSVLHGVVALMRYSRFLLFGFGPEADFRKLGSMSVRNSMRGLAFREIGDEDSEIFVAIPKDYLCPISLELMLDPVVVSTGQTYDRESILRWLDEGHNTCPNSGQVLSHKRLIPNRALRSVISQWCVSNFVKYDPPETSDYADGVVVPVASRAATEANKYTTKLLVKLLEEGSEDGKATAAHGLRLLAKTGKENRAYIAEAGAIPLLRRLLSSANLAAQENAVTALLNLSILDTNKCKIVEEEGCLRPIVDVLIHGLTTEARENAAATLFSLSLVHDHKKMIIDEEGAVEALAMMLREGTPRGKKDAVMALFNLSTYMGSCERMVESGIAATLVDALEMEGVAEEAAGALALLLRQKFAAEAAAVGDSAVNGLVGLMRRGTPKAKENAVSALFEMCRSGGPAVTEKVALVPMIGGLIQTVLFTGTKRARRKALSLARLFQRHEASGAMRPGGWVAAFAFARSRSMRRTPAAGSSGDPGASAPVSVLMSVPAL